MNGNNQNAFNLALGRYFCIEFLKCGQTKLETSKCGWKRKIGWSFILQQVLYCIYLPSIIKMQLHIYKFVKSRIDKNVCDEKYITAYTNLVYHQISDGRISLDILPLDILPLDFRWPKKAPKCTYFHQGPPSGIYYLLYFSH